MAKATRSTKSSKKTAKPARPEGRVPARTRRGVLARDRYRCVYCGATAELTVDHVLPQADGGSHDAHNLVTACGDCNNLRNRCPMKYWVQWCEDLKKGKAHEVATRVALALATPVPAVAPRRAKTTKRAR